ncbi:hypothetical protein CYMTET_31124, partial [Cymbomonas tetramitiformis]
MHEIERLTCLQDLDQFGSWQTDVKLWRRTWPVLDRDVILLEDYESADINGSCCIWSSSCVLAKFLELKSSDNAGLEGKRIVELGAGCGLVALTTAAHGANVVATERAECLPFLQRNIELNPFAATLPLRAE